MDLRVSKQPALLKDNFSDAAPCAGVSVLYTRMDALGQPSPCGKGLWRDEVLDGLLPAWPRREGQLPQFRV